MPRFALEFKFFQYSHLYYNWLCYCAPVLLLYSWFRWNLKRIKRNENYSKSWRIHCWWGVDFLFGLKPMWHRVPNLLNMEIVCFWDFLHCISISMLIVKYKIEFIVNMNLISMIQCIERWLSIDHCLSQFDESLSHRFC